MGHASQMSGILEYGPFMSCLLFFRPPFPSSSLSFSLSSVPSKLPTGRADRTPRFPRYPSAWTTQFLRANKTIQVGEQKERRGRVKICMTLGDRPFLLFLPPSFYSSTCIPSYCCFPETRHHMSSLPILSLPHDFLIFVPRFFFKLRRLSLLMANGNPRKICTNRWYCARRYRPPAMSLCMCVKGGRGKDGARKEKGTEQCTSRGTGRERSETIAHGSSPFFRVPLFPSLFPPSFLLPLFTPSMS